MKVAVTTASGHLGSAIIKRLKKESGDYEILGIARTPRKAEQLGVEIRKGDYSNYNEMNSALKGIDVLLLVSGMDHPEKRISQHRNVINAAKENKVKKIVYTSIIGAKEGNAFSPVVTSNRKTEEDIKNSGLEWAIGRNGLYIEPDLEYIDNYIKENGIVNCADTGKCGYTSRNELAEAYFKLITDNSLTGNTYNLFGTPITQGELADAINKAYGTNLQYKYISPKEFIESRKENLGEFLGTVIGGIYDGIRTGKFDTVSDFVKVAGRPHKSVHEMINEFKNNQPQK